MDFNAKDTAAVLLWTLGIIGMMLWMHFDRPKAMIVIEPGLIPATCEANGWDSSECRMEMYVRFNARLEKIEKILQTRQQEAHQHSDGGGER